MRRRTTFFPFSLLAATVALCLSVLPATLGAQRPAAARTQAWQRGATCYEVFVRSFADSNGDGIGDLRGLLAHFDYINDGKPGSTQSLGARCIWLMPIMASPSYHGYDVRDYYRVQPEYGTDDDLRRLVALAHARGVRVLLDMVINHVSIEHPWFQAALRDTTSKYRAFFRWSPTPGPNNRWGDNNWRKSPVRDEYYYAFFWQGMPDLNYDRPEALAEIQRVATYWLRTFHVDGFRMDAVKFLGEEGGTVEDVPRTHEVLAAYNAHVHRIAPNAFVIGEVFDNNRSLLTYYPNQLDSYFAFEVADSIIAGVRRGDARGILAPAIELERAVPDQRWSPFLRNHDQPRTLTELGDDVSKARIAAAIQLSMPGLPFVYYGEELGMRGPKPDERIRTPLAWSRTAPHAGFSTGTPWQSLGDDSLSANIDAQQHDSTSMLSLYRRLIALRAASPALASGALVPLASDNAAVLAYLRQRDNETVLVIANLGDVDVAPGSLTLRVAPGLTRANGAAAEPLRETRYAMHPLVSTVSSSNASTFVAVAGSAAGRSFSPSIRLAAHSAQLFSLRVEPRRR